MAAPWEKYQKAPWTKYSKPEDSSGPESYEDVNARVRAKYGSMSFGDRIKNDLGSALSGVTPVIRGGWDALSAIPSLAADAGVGLRNTLTGSNYDLPSQMSEASIDQVLPMPTTPGAKTLRAGTAILAGGKLPAPQINNQAPAGFVKPAQDLVRQQTLQGGQKLGLVVPPSTTNPTATNKILESIGGKIATAQDAAVRNQNVFTNVGKRAIGMTEDAPMTPEGLSAIRKGAGDAYQTLRKVGEVKLDEQSVKSIDALASKFTGSKLKEALGGGNDIPKIVQALKDEPLTGDTAVDAIDLLRNSASKAYAGGDKQLGKAYKSLSETIENLMERNLSGDELKAFKDARQLIAKTYSVEGAFNPGTGQLAGTKLGAQLTKGKPLSGDLKTAARFAKAFPKASQAVTDSGSVRNTDVIMGAGTAALSREPSYLLYPFLRQGMRNFMLSKSGQKLATPGASNGISPEMAMMLLQATEQSRTR